MLEEERITNELIYIGNCLYGKPVEEEVWEGSIDIAEFDFGKYF
jgi:hypothetical protein